MQYNELENPLSQIFNKFIYYTFINNRNKFTGDENTRISSFNGEMSVPLVLVGDFNPSDDDREIERTPFENILTKRLHSELDVSI